MFTTVYIWYTQINNANMNSNKEDTLSLDQETFKTIYDGASFISRFRIGERVKLTVIQTKPIYGYVRAVIFTASKVRYSIWIREAETTLHNIDSVYIEGMAADEFEIIPMGEDNYS